MLIQDTQFYTVMNGIAEQFDIQRAICAEKEEALTILRHALDNANSECARLSEQNAAQKSTIEEYFKKLDEAHGDNRLLMALVQKGGKKKGGKK